VILVWLSAGIFGAGLYTVLTRRDLIAILAGVELMLGAASVAFVSLSAATGAPAADTEAVGLLLIVMAATEAAVGMALVIALSRASTRSTTTELTEVRG
jgi:NADH:ubiquinone oxidoreductase subunit K